MTPWSRLAAAGIVALVGLGGCQANSPSQVGAPVGAGELPAWAKAELDEFAALNDFAETALDKFFDPATGKPIVAFHHGVADDVVEGVSTWDRFVLNGGSAKVRRGMVNAWQYIYDDLVRSGDFVDGFYAKGYDAEHTGELYQMLFACMEFDPSNAKLVEANRKIADVIIDRCYNRETRLLKHRILDSQGGDSRANNPFVDDMLNLMYILPAFRAWMTTGDEKYRRWAIEYGTSWNELAAANGGVFPFSVNSRTREVPKEWWGTSSFDYKVYGMIVAGRYLHGWTTALVMMDGGGSRHLSGLNGTLAAMFRQGKEGLPWTRVDETGWSRGRGCWFVPKLADRSYALTFDPAAGQRIRDYYDAATAAAAKGEDKDAAGEAQFLAWHMFTYFGSFDLDWAAKQFTRGASAYRTRRERIAALVGDALPKTGDQITEQVQSRPIEMGLVDGSYFGMYDNGRAGGPCTASIRYYRSDGTCGLPAGVAALVRRVDKAGLHVLLCNTTAEPVTMDLVGGFYGQHRIDTVADGDMTHRPGGRRFTIVLPARGLADLTLGLTRFAYRPTLTPLTSSAKPAG